MRDSISQLGNRELLESFDRRLRSGGGGQTAAAASSPGESSGEGSSTAAAGDSPTGVTPTSVSPTDTSPATGAGSDAPTPIRPLQLDVKHSLINDVFSSWFSYFREPRTGLRSRVHFVKFYYACFRFRLRTKIIELYAHNTTSLRVT